MKFESGSFFFPKLLINYNDASFCGLYEIKYFLAIDFVGYRPSNLSNSIDSELIFF